MILDEYKCIFIHIPKTAGTAIQCRLEGLTKVVRGMQDHRTIEQLRPFSFNYFARAISTGCALNFVKKEMNYLRRKEQIRISNSKFNTYFKFTFVRNSWARAFSWYGNLMRDENLRITSKVPSTCSFRDYLYEHLDKEYALNSQLDWITDINGDIPLDFIGRFENINEDFSYVCKLLNIKKDTDLKRINMGDGLDYTKVYDAEMKDVVAQKYAKEIAFFNFQFGE